MTKNATMRFHPWPIDELLTRLGQDTALMDLTRARNVGGLRNVREVALERLAREVMAQRFGATHVVMRRPIGSTLRLSLRPFPSTAQPDVALHHEGQIHFCEVKSSRTDYPRFDCVCDSKAFREFLRTRGHDGPSPWEVEQDLIKLDLYKTLSPQVGSCLFLMVDAYEGAGQSWTRIFENRASFVATMRTQLVKSWVDRIFAATHIEPIHSHGMTARVIVCAVHS